MTEREVQDALYRYLRAHGGWPIFPNMDCITGYEADLLVITKAGYAHEYEIKLCRSDFRADLKKRHKHASLSGATKEIPYPYQWGTEKKTIHVIAGADVAHPMVMRERCYPNLRPKHFWYVISGFEVAENEIPPYSGLLKFEDPHRFSIIKQAPALESLKVEEKRIRHAQINMLYRYWNMRLERTGKAGDKL